MQIIILQIYIDKNCIFRKGLINFMKATGIVRRIDDLGRVVIPKEIRRTMRIREGDPSQTTLENPVSYCYLLLVLAKRLKVT